MDDGNDNPTQSAQRLEHALERIALAMANSMAAKAPEPANQEAAEVKARLDALIDRLRTELAQRPD